MIVRKAVLAEAQVIRALETEVWNESVSSTWDIATFVRYGYAYVALHKAEIRGALVGIEQQSGGVYIVDVVVRSAHRQSGIATQLYKALMRDYPNKVLTTHVSPKYEASVQLHEKLGFTKLKIEKDAYGLDGKDGPRLLLEYRPV